MRFSTILAGLLSASTTYAAVINAGAAPVEARDDAPTPVDSPTPADAPTPVQGGDSPDLVARTSNPEATLACRPGTFRCQAATQVSVCNHEGRWLESARCNNGCCREANDAAWCVC